MERNFPRMAGRCGRIYRRGTHRDKAMEHLATILGRRNPSESEVPRE